MKIKCNIDYRGFTEKPGTFPPILRKTLCSASSTKEVTPEELIAAIEQGQSFTPAALTGTTGDTWKSQQIICADIDNDATIRDEAGGTKKVKLENPLTPERALEVMEHYDIKPYFMYYSFSNKDDFPKFRIVLILEEPLTDPAVSRDLTQRFTAIFNAAAEHCADTTAADPARIYYGCKPGGVFYKCEMTTSREELETLPAAETAPRAPEPPKSAPERTKARISTSEPPKGEYEALLAQFERDKEGFDLAGYVIATTGSRPKMSGKTLFLNPCPLCGHKDDFQITGSVYHCHGASGGTGGTIIDYLMNRDNLHLDEAIDRFKFQIMGYDRDEWKQAYIAMRTGAPEVQKAAGIGAELPGLLTTSRAMQILNDAPDDFLELPRFPQFAEAAKITAHDTVVIAAETGAGKSSLALNFLYDLHEHHPALYFNLEMDEATIIQRLAAIHTGEDLDRIEGYKQDPATRAKVNNALQAITAGKDIQLISDCYELKEITAAITAATQNREDTTLVFIDTGLLVKPERTASSRYERFTQISEELRRISRQNNIIMFVLMQQNREGKKDKKKPDVSSLKESGSWENDATKIIFLWENPKTGIKELLLEKNRNGKSGRAPLRYSPHTQTYSETGDFEAYTGGTGSQGEKVRWK